MGSQQTPPRYPHRPIRQLEILSRVLGVSLSTLQNTAGQASALYREAKQIKKSDGSIRQPYDALEPLKHIQRRIKQRILDKVHFPDYLTGSVRGKDAQMNAALHVGAAVLVCEDISNFFPSTTANVVGEVWSEFFHFSPEVAHLLTALTTRLGALPQGAITSSHLANLALWREEHSIFEALNAEGISYSRYVDDITFSSRRNLAPEELTRCILSVYSLMWSKGYRPKRRKQEIQRSHRRITVTKLVTNKRVALPARERHRVRASVKELELHLDQWPLDTVRARLASVTGRVSRLKRMHPTEGERLHARLKGVRTRLKSLARAQAAHAEGPQS